MGGPDVAARKAQIAAEPAGSYYIGRRYFVHKTRFWGYVRKPREPWQNAQLVVMREDQRRQPDRLAEDGPPNRRFGFDQNYEYRLQGKFTGKKIYDPNSNQILPEFLLTDYKLLDPKPGWLFHPNDKYDPYRITIYKR